MRNVLIRMAAAVLLTSVLSAEARAQVYVTPNAIYVSPSATRPGFTSLAVRTTVAVPDGGTALLGGYSSVSDGRRESGAPILGRLPYGDRGYRNDGSGRAATSVRVSVSTRMIILR